MVSCYEQLCDVTSLNLSTITGLRLQDAMIVSYSNLLTVCPSHLLLLLCLIIGAKKKKKLRLENLTSKSQVKPQTSV